MNIQEYISIETDRSIWEEKRKTTFVIYVTDFLIEIQHTESARSFVMTQPGFSVGSRTSKAQASPERMYRKFLLQSVLLLPFCCNYFKFCPSSLIPSLLLTHPIFIRQLSSLLPLLSPSWSRASKCSEDLHTDMLFTAEYTCSDYGTEGTANNSY